MREIMRAHNRIIPRSLDLGMSSMFGRTGAPQRRGRHKRTVFFLFLQHGNKPEILKLVYWGVYAGIRRIPASGFFDSV